MVPVMRLSLAENEVKFLSVVTAVGKLPEIVLPPTLKSASSGQLTIKCGKVPLNWLFPALKVVNSVRLANDCGIIPVSDPQSATLSDCSWPNRPSSVGSDPLNCVLLPRLSVCKAVRLPSAAGILPVILFDDTSNWCNRLRPLSAAGRVPVSAFSDSCKVNSVEMRP